MERKCEHCDFATTHKAEMTTHMREMHLRVVEQCQKCDYITPDKALLCRHMRSLHPESVKSCPSCYFATFDEMSVVQHIKAKHPKSGVADDLREDQGINEEDVDITEEYVECQLCDFMSPESSLTEHIVKCHVAG